MLKYINTFYLYPHPTHKMQSQKYNDFVQRKNIDSCTCRTRDAYLSSQIRVLNEFSNEKYVYIE